MSKNPLDDDWKAFNNQNKVALEGKELGSMEIRAKIIKDLGEEFSELNSSIKKLTPQTEEKLVFGQALRPKISLFGAQPLKRAKDHEIPSSETSGVTSSQKYVTKICMNHRSR
ncbi:MAG: hypothetical protein SFT91_02450 [Rickettsiaceae bacterium]|nr:hypothetical protein [Rickettsiaceae bacterium]